MRATDLLTTLNIDFSYIEITQISLDIEGAIFGIARIDLTDEKLIFTPAKIQNNKSVKEITTTLMLHKQKILYKQRGTELEKIYGYRIKDMSVIL